VSELSRTRWSLIDSARAGDQAALNALLEKHRPSIVGYFHSHGLEGDAEDLAQEVLLRFVDDDILRRADPSKGRFRNLVFAVARNVRSHHVGYVSAKKRGGGAVCQLGDLDVTAPEPPDDVFDREWFARLLAIAFARLKEEYPDYHEALQLSLEEQSREAMSQALSLTQDAVKNRVHRARQKVMGFVQEEIWAYSRPEEFKDEVATFAKLLPT
jgi:RNA polymerase sigma-70 factor (ECF subfamily)